MLQQRLRQLRKEYEVDKQELARYMRVDIERIEAWERGEVQPTQAECKRLAALYQMSVEELLDKPKQSDAPKQNSTKKGNDKKARTKKKTKKKTKHKTRHKTKTKKETVEKKRRIWPVVLLILLLIAALGAGGVYVYWKYGDDYAIVKKKTYQMSDLAGTYTAKKAHDATPSQLILHSDGSYQLSMNLCSAMQEESGRWSLDKNTLTLEGATSHPFTIKDKNQLVYDGDTLSCGPYHQDVFIRNTNHTQASQTDTPKEENQTSPIGTYSGDHSTLVVSQAEKTQLVFTLSTLDANDSTHVATLSDIKASWDGQTASFSFTDDGYGNSGSGTIQFENNTAVLHIQLVKNKDALWSIAESGTLYR